MKMFPVRQVSVIDQYTIEHEPILSINLMERAALAFYRKFKTLYANEAVHLLVGPGNNGGDALAIARLLLLDSRKVVVWLVNSSGRFSKDADINLHRLRSFNQVAIYNLEDTSALDSIPADAVCIDGLFGSGLNRPVEGLALQVVMKINQLPNPVVAIDIPSGLFGEDNTTNKAEGIIKADYTISFQFPKLAFLLSENEDFVGTWETVDIGLDQEVINTLESEWFYQQKEDVQPMLKSRSRFGHKGNYGHALLVAGSYGKMGAAVLASRGCLKSGAGLLTTHVPHVGYPVLQTAVPEAMVSIDRSDFLISEFPELHPFNAIGIGPGIGKKPNTQKALHELIKTATNSSLLLDADALNILAEHASLVELLPEGTILTPHPGEFDRLAGKSQTGFERLQKAVAFAKKHKVVIVLKGAYTVVISAEGQCYFNSTGNPGMATAGSGDVLTGIILSLLAQRYSPVEAARLGVYVHGMAGDQLYSDESYEGITAGGLINALGSVFKQIRR